MIDGMAQLSERELEILKLVAEGKTNQQIAHVLNISHNTVKVHVRKIFEKTGASSRTEASMFAVRLGLVEINATPLNTPNGPISVSIASPAEPQPPAEVPTSAPPPIDESPLEPAITPAPSSPIEQIITNRTLEVPPVAVVHPRLPLLSLVLGILVIVLIVIVGLLTVRQRQFVVAPTPLATQPWKGRAALLPAREDFAVVTYYDNRVYVIGGAINQAATAQVERYDPTTDAWATFSNKPTAVHSVQAVAIGGRIYVPGGETTANTISDALEVYDPRVDRWETMPALPKPRSRYALAAVEGQLYLFGGWDGTQYCADVFAFDPISKRWTTRTPMLTARRNSAAAVVDNRVYLLGGENAAGPLRVNERYDPANEDNQQAWSTGAPLPVAIAHPAVAVVPGTVLLIAAEPRTILRYTPVTEVWAPSDVPANLPLSSRTTLVGNSIFVFGPASGVAAPGALSEYQTTYSTFLPFTVGS